MLQRPDGAYCSELNTTLATVDVRSSYWRLSAASDTVYTCAQPSSCVGGKSAGERGEGYCAPGHQGALCEVCTAKAASRPSLHTTPLRPMAVRETPHCRGTLAT